jgi:hypothetical protein
MVLWDLRVPPQLVNTGEGEEAAVGPVDVEGLLRLPLGDPFVVAVRGDQAAPLRERGAERRLDRDRLRASVDHAGPDRGVLRPARHQAPPDQPELALFLVVEHRVDPLRRRDVVIRLAVGGHGITRGGELLKKLKPLTS